METKLSAKDRILQVATELFYREGVRAVGIDRIIEESGVAKASFYRNFPTKDDLVVAFLEQYQNRTRGRIEKARSAYPGEPYRQLLELFRLSALRMNEQDFRGCPFMNTTVEFPDDEHPANRMARASRMETWRVVADMAREAGARDPEALATQLEIVYSGAMMTAVLYRQPDYGDQFYKTVQTLLKEHIPQ